MDVRARVRARAHEHGDLARHVQRRTAPVRQQRWYYCGVGCGGCGGCGGRRPRAHRSSCDRGSYDRGSNRGISIVVVIVVCNTARSDTRRSQRCGTVSRHLRNHHLVWGIGQDPSGVVVSERWRWRRCGRWRRRGW